MNAAQTQRIEQFRKRASFKNVNHVVLGKNPKNRHNITDIKDKINNQYHQNNLNITKR
jgi:hypothetical protein